MQSGDAEGKLSTINHQDLVLLGTLGACIVSAALSELAAETKLLVTAVCVLTGIYLVVVRLLLRDAHSNRLLIVRIPISLLLASVPIYLGTARVPEFRLAYVFIIILYATRFGANVGVLTAMGASAGVFLMSWLTVGFQDPSFLLGTTLYTIIFFFVGMMSGMATSDLHRRNEEAAGKLRELGLAHEGLEEKTRVIEKLNEELQLRGEELEFLATTDSLTGLANRRYFEEVFRAEFERAVRYRRALSIVMIDVDNLKKVNDTYGHQYGDALLAGVGLVLRHRLRAPDLAARYGGDEFVALLPETSAVSASAVGERIRTGIAEHVFQDPSLKANVSIGVASYPCEGVGSEVDLVRVADRALYEAKKRRRLEETGKSDFGQEEA